MQEYQVKYFTPFCVREFDRNNGRPTRTVKEMIRDESLDAAAFVLFNYPYEAKNVSSHQSEIYNNLIIKIEEKDDFSDELKSQLKNLYSKALGFSQKFPLNHKLL